MDFIARAFDWLPTWFNLEFLLNVYNIYALFVSLCVVKSSSNKFVNFRLLKRARQAPAEEPCQDEQRVADHCRRPFNFEEKAFNFPFGPVYFGLCDSCREEEYREARRKMSSSKTVENYVAEIVSKIKDADYPYIGGLYDTLQKMKSSTKQKHEDNYWKVIQCLGETGTDVMIRSLVLCEQSSCKCHIIRNLNVLMLILVEMQSSVAVIKHVNMYKEKVVPIMFKAIRQKEIPELTRKGFAALYRCLIVGKFAMVELLMSNNIFRDIQEYVKSKMQFYNVQTMEGVEYCTNILHAMSVIGGTNTQRRVKSSQALKMLLTYAKVFKENNKSPTYSFAMWNAQRDELFEALNELLEVLFGETKENEKDSWHPKDLLNEDLGCEPSYFCSCPSCRKPCSEKDKYLYCGACKLARYCSEKCQKEHWKNGHKSACLNTTIPDADFGPF